jgi:two-component system, response regulator FlrC
MQIGDDRLPGIGGLVGRTVTDVERALILKTLQRYSGNRTRSADVLGISIRTLRNKIHQYSAEGIEVPPSCYQFPFSPNLANKDPAEAVG